MSCVFFMEEFLVGLEFCTVTCVSAVQFHVP